MLGDLVMFLVVAILGVDDWHLPFPLLPQTFVGDEVRDEGGDVIPERYARIEQTRVWPFVDSVSLVLFLLGWRRINSILLIFFHFFFIHKVVGANCNPLEERVVLADIVHTFGRHFVVYVWVDQPA